MPDSLEDSARVEATTQACRDRFCYRRIYRDGVCAVLRHTEMRIEMAQNVNIDTVRAAALARIDRSERNFKLAFIGAVIVESLFLAAFLLLADFSNRLHVLLLISTVSCYTIIVLGLVAIGTYINRGIARVLKAVELS